MVSGWWLGIAAGKAFFILKGTVFFTLMKNLLSHTHFSIVVLLLGMLCLEGCSFYHNFIWYEPYLADENGKVTIPENIDEDGSNNDASYEIWDYYAKTTANTWFIFFFPFIPLGEDYQGPHPYRHTGDFVIWVKKGEVCPVVYIGEKPVDGKKLEKEPDDITGMNKDYDLCHFGKLPVEQQQVYTIKYKGEEKRYLFIKKQWKGYRPFWIPDA